MSIVCIIALVVLFGLSVSIMKTVISMKGFFLFVGFFSIAIVFYHIGKNNTFINLLGLVIAFAVSIWWLLEPNWLVINIMGISIVLQVLLGLPRIALKNLIIIAIGLVGYDIVAVYFLDTMEQMSRVAIDNQLPMLIMVPRTLSFIDTSYIFALGLGDIILPALFIKEEIYRAKEYNFPKVFGVPLMPLVLIVVYIMGIVTATIVVFTMRISQPALVFIIPSMLICLGIAYFVAGRQKCSTKY